MRKFLIGAWWVGAVGGTCVYAAAVLIAEWRGEPTTAITSLYAALCHSLIPLAVGARGAEQAWRIVREIAADLRRHRAAVPPSR